MSTPPKRIALGADHGGFELKAALAAHLREAGHQVEDLGTSS
ncbi:MAG: RpiB/LacA/LacB family sugar-phosphate isomerase, partial [Proteobacteria bacterium]|nr:RpiB/LacA/LacB family sugar-phosphate isomerase [Pseudomonadota bacterium]